LVRAARVVELHGRDDQALLIGARRMRWHRAWHRPADVVVVPEDLHERDDVVLVEDGERDAEVRQVADPALGAVYVVVEVDVARPHGGEREVAHDRLHERGIGAPGELSASPVVDAGPEVASVADHRRARGALDGSLDLGLDRGEHALDDLQHDGIGALDDHDLVAGCAVSTEHDKTPDSLVRSRLPKRSTSVLSPGNTTVVAPYSSTIA